MDLSQYKLIIFDMDGTLADRDTGELLPGVASWFTANWRNYEFALATNQGGVGLRHWMEVNNFGNPEKYPTRADVGQRIGFVIHQIELVTSVPATQYSGATNIEYVKWMDYVCYRYQSKKGEWSPVPTGKEDDPRWSKAWRKPNAGMLESAMRDYSRSPISTLMVGDREEDQLAANNAGVDFIHADNFFNRASS